MKDSRQLRICFLLFRAYPVFNRDTNEAFGGSEVELYNLANYFSRYNFVKVDFIVGDYGQKDIETYNNIALRKVRYMREEIYKPFRYKIARYFYFFKILLTQSSDIFITKTASEHLGWMVIFLKFLRRRKVIFRLGSDKDTEFEFWKDSWKRYFLYKLGLRNSDLIYVQTEDQKKMLKENCGLDGRVLKNLFPMEKGKANYKKEYILWVSRCEPLKRPELFLELARRIPGEKFVMIMPHMRKANELENAYDTNMTAACRNAAFEMKNFEYHEFVPFHQIQQYYNNAKLFINTSEYEGFPNSFIQSCLGRTGILTFQVNPDGFLTKNNLGYCCGDDLGKAMEFISGLDGDKVGQLGENAYGYVKRNHDASRIGQVYLEDFINLTNWKMKKRCYSSWRN